MSLTDLNETIDTNEVWKSLLIADESDSYQEYCLKHGIAALDEDSLLSEDDYDGFKKPITWNREYDALDV